MNSKWQIHKIGLVDFWYYDEEEFYFEEGRMLLRGANGSGKSVTMQSFIPLLLDGNMRPERLDPFGSKARRMENYLLEDGDGRQERTGYLYMEFKRQGSETFVSVGIGMRARRGKPLDTWYFLLQDGRRIKQDFFLYRQEKQKIPLTKTELRNRIGDGGQVLDSQKEYMAMVNKLIFGFETIEGYKELIDLLIQLRTPKLSKDFKPTIINDILSDSLMPLSEDDLRPMSEAIENMDGLKTSLDNLRETRGAAGKIKRVFDRYNRFVLFDKARKFRQLNQEYRQEERRIKALLEELEAGQKQLEQDELQLVKLQQELKVRQAEKDSLGSSDAARLKEQEQELLETLGEDQRKQEEKRRNREQKEARRKDLEWEHKRLKEEQERQTDQLIDLLQEMEDLLQVLPFDEFAFMKKDLLENPLSDYGFEAQKTLLKRLKSQLEEGLGLLSKEQQLRQVYDSLLAVVEARQQEQEQKEREIRQYEQQLREVKNELTEKVYAWRGHNQELTVPDAVMQEITTGIEQFTKESSYVAIKDLTAPVIEAANQKQQKALAGLLHEQEQWQAKIGAKEAELLEWQNKQDPEPDLSEAAARSRQALRQAGIAFTEFYKTVDFPRDWPAEKVNRLEEALFKMGILNAVVIDAEEREKVLALDAGLADTYIFSNVEHVKNSLSDFLEIANEDNNILFFQKISNVLQGIGYGGSDFHTRIYEDGHYRLGIITGTITREYEARYIGTLTRARYRRQRIEQLQQELVQLKAENALVAEQIAAIRQCIEQLKQEKESFPDGTDLILAVAQLTDREGDLKQIVQALKREQDQLLARQQELNEVRKQVQEAAGKVYLAPKLEIFQSAKDEAEEYQELLTQTQLICSGLRNLQSQQLVTADQLEQVDEDLDVLIREGSDILKELEKRQALLHSVREQLKLTNYEEIKEKLDFAVQRLKELPEEEKSLLVVKTKREDALEQQVEAKARHVEQSLSLRQKLQFSQKGVEQEVQLGYYPDDLTRFTENDNLAGLCEYVVKTEGTAFEQIQREDVAGSLQNAYHENRGYLLEYSPVMETIFAGTSESREFAEIILKRLNITAKYRGINVNFKEFLIRLEQDIEEKESLLSDKERELFENILIHIIGRKIRAKIYSSEEWVAKMNALMGGMKTSSGLTLFLRWKSKNAEHEGQLDTRRLVELLKKDPQWMSEEESERLIGHFRSKIQEARKLLEQSDGVKSFHGLVREILDYRKWFEFQLEFQKTGEAKKELTDRIFFTFSGGEKAMAMYVPLFSAVVAKYQAANGDAPRLISLDEAFAGVDEQNIKDMFRLMVDFDFAFIINSQILWGDYETVPRLAIYQLLRPDNARFVTVISYLWNGKVRELKTEEEHHG